MKSLSTSTGVVKSSTALSKMMPQTDAAPAKRPRKRTQPAEDERIPEKALKGRAISNHATFGKARVQHSSAKPVESKTRTVTDYS